ncbi:D-alanyl-D-alanine carboxypeptidase/D-alanyl-D-alanine-endopeptidase [Lapillicoccus sp.]|uniref:D-alanyl-D-alanine carboxypeptidase/D-alanyl-D-alanine endopeptidase n=1 Tax=Lapillicoccus sp. TaxID=1909287 RepID=UPI0032638172
MRRILAALGVLLLLVVGYAALDVYDVVPGVLTLANAPDPPTAQPSPTESTAEPSTPPVSQPRADPAGMPLATSGAQQPEPTAAGLAAALGPALADPAIAGRLGVSVRDAATGTHLLDVDAQQPLIPASNLKLLSAAAVHATFPAGATLTTKVVQGGVSGESGQLLLVAGGDTLLASGAGDPASVVGRAGLGDLVSATASALRAQGVARASVALDLSYAPGPLTASTWSPSFVPDAITGAVTTIGLAVDRAEPGRPGSANPAISAQAAFVAALTAAGIPTSVAPAATAPAGAPVLASVTSAPVADQLALAIVDSDDALTESLTRQAAFVKGTAPGFAATAAFVQTTLAGLGVDLTGVSLADTSGLSRQNVLPVRVIGDMLALGTDPGSRLPAMQATLQSLPVAGLSGTLAGRFEDATTRAAAGVAQAKTGTLTGVSALAGTVVTAEGRLLTFAIVSNSTGGAGGTPAARAALDRFVTVLVSCGCRT